MPIFQTFVPQYNFILKQLPFMLKKLNAILSFRVYIESVSYIWL